MSFFRSVLGLLPGAIVVVAVSGCPPPPTMTLESREARILGVDREKAEDPVSGRMVWKGDAIKREYRGAIYFFESAGNALIFDRNPALYAVIENVAPNDYGDVK
jgi:YHS domain-containing protein